MCKSRLLIARIPDRHVQRMYLARFLLVLEAISRWADDARSKLRKIEMLPLTGVKVLDLGTITMGPYAGQWLGDLGADVVKVEPPSGDVTRNMGPYAEPGMGAAFLGLNRNKRGIVM